VVLPRAAARCGGDQGPGGLLERTHLYLDQNYLSGFAKGKPAFRELEPVLRDAIEAGAVVVVESEVHERESRPRPDLGLLELLHELSRGERLPATRDRKSERIRRRMAEVIAREHPARMPRAGDEADLDALALALRHCDLVTCDAFMADVIRRLRLDVRERCELFTGRRADVERLRDRLRSALQQPAPPR
jgi:hypothetical protein